MTEPTSAQELFKGRHFDQEIIVLCVRWYLTFKLSSRDLVQMMAERGITLTHTAILRWVQRYVPEFEKHWSHEGPETAWMSALACLQVRIALFLDRERRCPQRIDVHAQWMQLQHLVV